MQLNSQSPVPNSVLCRSAYCQKSSGNLMWSLYRGLKDWNLPLNVMGISRVVVLFIRCFLLLLSLSLLLFIRYFCHLIIVILLKQIQRRLPNFHLNVFPTLRLYYIYKPQSERTDREHLRKVILKTKQKLTVSRKQLHHVQKIELDNIKREI